MCRSVPQMPHESTATTTSPLPGVGSSTVVTATLPGSSTTAARMFRCSSSGCGYVGSDGDDPYVHAESPDCFQLVVRCRLVGDHQGVRAHVAVGVSRGLAELRMVDEQDVPGRRLAHGR